MKWLAIGAALLALASVVPASVPFTDAAAATGLTFTHVNGATGRYYMPELIGSGVALVDYDNDGDLDVFLVQGGALGPGASGGPETSRLFRNDMKPGSPGTLHFTDVTTAAGVGLRAYGMGVAVADYDNDGDMDILVTTFGPETLFRNNGNGTFTDVTAAAGVSDPLWSTSAAFVDYDRDGDLDLFVANYLDFTIAGSKSCFDATGVPDYCGPRAYRPAPNRLYRNDAGRFTDVTGPAGIDKADGPSLGVAVGDYNHDGWPDLYVANDAAANQLWLNQRDGTFADDGLLSGSALNAAGAAEGSMGIASGDVDGDGHEDLFISNIAAETFALYRNDGKGQFEDVRSRWGLAALTAAFTGFGTGLIDYDNDGWLDLFVANGAVNTIPSQRGQAVPFRMRNILLRNSGDGQFVDVAPGPGSPLALLNVGRGAAFGDVDNDGDTDIVVTTNNGPVQLLLNTSPPRHWLEIALRRDGANRFGYGARVGVERAGKPTLWRRVGSDGSYLSASDPRVHVGLGDDDRPVNVVVEWPDGRVTRQLRVRPDQRLTIRAG